MNNYSNMDPSAMMGPMMGVFMLVGLAVIVLMIFFQWKIFAKAGFPGALALINLAAIIPLVGPLIVIGLQGWFAFADWPALKKPPQP